MTTSGDEFFLCTAASPMPQLNLDPINRMSQFIGVIRWGDIWGGRPIRVKLHGSVLHAMLRVGLATADGSVSEERLEAEFDVVHLHDAVDGAFAQFVGPREDIHRYGS